MRGFFLAYGPGTVPPSLVFHFPCSPMVLIPAAPGTPGPQHSTLRLPKITNIWQDFLTMEGLLHCIYFIAEETGQRDVKRLSQPLFDVPVQLLSLCPDFLNFGLNFQFYLKHMNPAFVFRGFRLTTAGHFLCKGCSIPHPLSDGQIQNSCFPLHRAF